MPLLLFKKGEAPSQLRKISKLKTHWINTCEMAEIPQKHIAYAYHIGQHCQLGNSQTAMLGFYLEETGKNSKFIINEGDLLPIFVPEVMRVRIEVGVRYLGYY